MVRWDEERHANALADVERILVDYQGRFGVPAAAAFCAYLERNFVAAARRFVPSIVADSAPSSSLEMRTHSIDAPLRAVGSPAGPEITPSSSTPPRASLQ